MLYQSASGTTASTAAGTAGYVLTSNGTAPPTYQSAGSSYNPASVAITGGTISASTINATTSQSLNGNLIMSATAPTISSGFGTGASVTFSNGTAAFYVAVGTGGTASTGLINMNVVVPHYWSCAVTIDNDDLGTGDETLYSQIGNQYVGFTHITRSTGAATPWIGNDVFFVNCVAY